MLDDVDEVSIRLRGRLREVARADEEERCPPRSPAIDAVAARAERVVQPLTPRRPRRRPWVVENPCKAAGEDAESAEGEGQDQQRPSHPVR